MKTDISNKTVNFIIWYTENTSSIQSNVRYYNKKHYFMDRKSVSNNDNGDGGIEDLWNVYLNEMLG